MTTQSQPTPKHTPTPWHIERRHSDPETAAEYAEILPSVGGCWGEWSSQEICALYGAKEGSIQAANAAHIVHCVNSHPALVAENKRLREAAKTLAEQIIEVRGTGFKSAVEDGLYDHPGFTMGEEWLVLAVRAALAKEDV